MRIKSINEISAQFDRIAYYAYERNWFWICKIFENYKTNIERHLGIDDVCRAKYYGKGFETIKVPYEVYTR